MSVLNTRAMREVQMEIERIRRVLYKWAGRSILHDREAQEEAAKDKALVYVWLAAAVEQCVKGVLKWVLEELNKKNEQCQNLKLCLFASLKGEIFDSLQEVEKLQKWQVRQELLASFNSTAVAVFNTEMVPLDGRTIKAAHFETIWAALGLPGCGIPSARLRTAMNTLSKGRNDVAHGNVNPIRFGLSVDSGDVLKMVAAIEEVIIHFTDAIDDYFSSNAYLR